MLIFRRYSAFILVNYCAAMSLPNVVFVIGGPGAGKEVHSVNTLLRYDYDIIIY